MKKLVFVAGLVLLVGVIFFQSADEGSSPRPVPLEEARPAAAVPLDASASWPMYRGTPELSGAVRKIPGDRLKPVWRFSAGAPIKSGAVVAQGRVIVTTTKGNVCAVNLQTGEPVWKKCVCETITSPGLFLNVNGIPSFFCGTRRGDFLAFHADTGEALYTFKTAGSVQGGATFFQAGDELRVLFGSHDANVYCLAAATGERRYQIETDNYVNGTPARLGDMLILGGCDGFVRGFDPVTGSETMKIDLGSYIPSSPACRDRTAYVALHENVVQAIDFASATVRWQTRPPGKNEFFVPPAVNETHVVAASSEGRVFLLRREDGALTGTVKLSGKLESEPVVDAERLLIADLDGFIYWFDLKTGRQIRRLEHGSPISAPLVVFDRHLLVCDLSGGVTLYAPGE